MPRNEQSHSNLLNFPQAWNSEEEIDFIESEDDSGSEGGEEGGEGGRGTTQPLVDPSVFGLTNHLFLELLRQNEKKFSNGWVPVTQVPKVENNTPGFAENGPPQHPLIARSSKFSGDDKKVSANPQNSEPGAKNYQKLEHVLKPQLQHSLQHTHVAQPSLPIPRLTPPGG